MKIERMLNKNKSLIALVVLAVIVFLPIGYYAVSDAFPKSTGDFLEKPDPQYQECVEPTEYMRFHHMDLLLEIRDKVVREGIKQDVTLAECKKCHINRSKFCDRCHLTVNLHPDCFGCHDYPETARTAAYEESTHEVGIEHITSQRVTGKDIVQNP